jgi:hypothetical protein
MNDPVLFSIVIYVAFLALMALMHWFKTLDTDLWPAWRRALALGVLLFIVLLITRMPTPVVIGVLVTFGALYLRHAGHETEAIDGMILGSVAGATATIPLVVSAAHEPRILATGLIAGAVAGYGITFAASHVTDRKKQIALDVVTGIAAIGVAWLPRLAAVNEGVPESRFLLVAAGVLPLFVLIATFRQWPDVRRELRDEASLGFLSDADVRPTAHPFLRLGRAGWTDRRAHREFVRLATRIALRKRRQRSRSDDAARLHQLEIIKLRMQLQEMSRIDRAMHNRAVAGEDSSDTMPTTHEG